MSQRLGRFGDRFCIFCAALFAAVMVVQSLRAALSGLPLVVAGLVAGAGFLLLCIHFAPTDRRILPLLLVLRLALAVACALILAPEPIQDFNTMYQAACQLAQGDMTYLQNPYYTKWAYQSAFMAYEAGVIRLFGEGLLPLRLLNCLYMTGTVCLTYLIGKTFLPQRAAAAMSLLYAVYPAPLQLAGTLTNQHLSVFLLYLAVWLLVKEGELTFPRAVGAGALIALGNAIRPIGTVLVLALLLFGLLRCMLGQERPFLPRFVRWASAAVTYCAAFALITTAVVVSGINPTGLGNQLPSWKFLVGLNQDSNGSWNQADYETYQVEPFDQSERAMQAKIQERLAVGPVDLGKLAVRKSAVMWGDYEDFYWGFSSKDSEGPAIGPVTWGQLQLLAVRLDKGIYLLVLALCLCALALRVRRGSGGGTPLLLTVLFCGYYAVHLIIEIQSRYRYFIMPALFLLAGLALEGLVERRRQR